MRKARVEIEPRGLLNRLRPRPRLARLVAVLPVAKDDGAPNRPPLLRNRVKRLLNIGAHSS